MVNEEQFDEEEIRDDGEEIKIDKNDARPRLYIWHRTNGEARSHPTQDEGDDTDDADLNSKPPCFVCYVPPPVYYLPSCLEQNWLCESFGKIGCYGRNNSRVRRKILALGIVANCLSFILSVVACFSLSLDFDHIVSTGFSNGLVYLPAVDIPTSRIWIGLRGVAVRNFKGQSILMEDYVEGDFVLDFDSFCNLTGRGLENYMDPADCDSCASVSGGLVSAVLVSTLLVLPNIFTDILRMYPNYDLNCQKFFGSVLNLLSMGLSLYTYRGYASECFRSFRSGDQTAYPYLDAVTQSLVNAIRGQKPDFFPEDDPTVDIYFLWRPGNGLICIVLATLLKLVDIIAMLVIPAPDISHNRALQEEYEVLYGADDDEEEDSGDSMPPPDESKNDKTMDKKQEMARVLDEQHKTNEAESTEMSV